MKKNLVAVVRYEKPLESVRQAVEMISAIRFAWKNEPWDDIEVLTGKSMKPTSGKKKNDFDESFFRVKDDKLKAPS